jgi:hypothetical protein
MITMSRIEEFPGLRVFGRMKKTAADFRGGLGSNMNVN